MPGPSRLLALPVAALAVTAAFLFWRGLGAPVDLPGLPGGRLHCLSYTPFEPGVFGATGPGRVSRARIEDDLERLAPLTDCLRLYTPLGDAEQVLVAAERRRVSVLLGAWIGSNLDQNEKEIRAALDLAARHPRAVRMIVVGNEVLLRRELTPERLAKLIGSVKEESPVPVAYADVAHFIAASPAVAEAADVLLIHLLPYWDDPRPPAAGDAAAEVLERYADFRTRLPPKEIWIGETGWPSQGRMRGPGKPSLVSQARFVREFAARAADLGIPYNLIEAIDQPWKRRPEGTVGGFWGILDADRAPKFGLEGPVSDWPGWRDRWLATSAIALVMLAAGLRRRRSATGWLGLGGLALALGLSLVFQWDYAQATVLDWGDRAIAVGGAFLTLAAAVLLATAPRVPAGFAELARSLPRPRSIIASDRLRLAAFTAITAIPAAWIGLTLAFAPRHRDVPIAVFALPALAVALRAGRSAGGDRLREETLLGAALLAGGLLQLEWRNLESLAWFAIGALLAWPLLGTSGRRPPDGNP